MKRYIEGEFFVTCPKCKKQFDLASNGNYFLRGVPGGPLDTSVQCPHCKYTDIDSAWGMHCGPIFFLSKQKSQSKLQKSNHKVFQEWSKAEENWSKANPTSTRGHLEGFPIGATRCHCNACRSKKNKDFENFMDRIHRVSTGMV